MFKDLMFNLSLLKQAMYIRKYVMDTMFEERIEVTKNFIKIFKDVFFNSKEEIEEFDGILNSINEEEVKNKCRDLANKLAGNFKGNIVENRIKMYKIFMHIFFMYKMLTIQEKSLKN